MDKLVSKPSPGQLSAGFARRVSGAKTGGAGPERSAMDEDRRMAKACADFEAIFVQQMFKTMRASVPESGLLDGGCAEDLYISLLDQQVAEEMAHGEGSLGLANQMKNKLTHYLALGTLTKTK